MAISSRVIKQTIAGRRIPTGITFNFGICTSLDLSWRVPKEDLEIGMWNFIGITCFIGPVVLFGLEINKERVSVMFLNAMISFMWGC